MNRISEQIQSGAKSFLWTEYKALALYCVVVTVVLVLLYSVEPPTGSRLDGVRYGCAFLTGAALSAFTGWAGMRVATDANVRTAQAAKEEGLGVALRVAFTGGSVMAFMVVGYGLAGLSLLYGIMMVTYDPDGRGSLAHSSTKFIYAAETMAGFGFGASSIALFARVAGGIYTKAADVGADLVGTCVSSKPQRHALCVCVCVLLRTVCATTTHVFFGLLLDIM